MKIQESIFKEPNIRTLIIADCNFNHCRLQQIYHGQFERTKKGKDAYLFLPFMNQAIQKLSIYSYGARHIFEISKHRILSIQAHCCLLKESRRSKRSLAALTLRMSIEGVGGRFEARGSCVLVCQTPGMAEDGIQSKSVPWPKSQTGEDE